jgi:hypothetical protein
MKKYFLLLLTMFLALAIYAQPKKVGYFTLNKTMNETAASVAIDPVLRMLQADPNLEVTLNVVNATDIVDLTGYDVVVVQESFGGSNDILKPGHTLALDTFMVPVVFNKNYAFAANRAFVAGTTGGGAETEGVGYVYLKVDPANQSNDLFKGVTFVGDTVALFKVTTNDAGVTVNPDRNKAINYARNVGLLDAGGDTLKNTLLALPARINPAHTGITVCFNDIPAGTKVGSETLKARMITLGMNFGAICGAYGSNITSAGLTIWRNAVYMAAGLTVPDTPVDFLEWKIGYFTLKGKTMDPSAALPSEEPIITMLKNNNPQWEVEVNEVAADSVFDLASKGYDLVIVQESFNSSSPVLMPTGSLALDTISVPFIYNKTYALRDGRAFTGGALGSGAEYEGKGFVYLRVDPANQSNPLFKGITFKGDTAAMFRTTTNDAGVYINPDRNKALNYAIDVIQTNPSGDTISTLLARPARINPAHETRLAVSVNDIPAGTTIGSATLKARMIAIGMNFGAICAAQGTNMTSAGLTLWRNAVHSALGLPVPSAPVAAPIPEINAILVHGLKGDSLQYDFLTNNGINVTLFNSATRGLGLVSQDTIDMLNAADVVIIGRSPSSSMFQDSINRVAWNNLTVPVILNSPWIARNTRLNWFNSGDAVQNNASGITVARIDESTDPIFANTPINNDTAQWSYLADDYIRVTSPFNGDTIAYRTEQPLVVRFMVDSAFYPGARDTVVAPRTYFGFGNDNAGPNNYFPLTDGAQAAYLSEIMRITGNPPMEPLYYISADASIKSISVQPVNIQPVFDPATLTYEVVLEQGPDYDTIMVSAIAGSNRAKVYGAGTYAITGDTVIKVYAIAQNTRKGNTYTINVIVQSTQPGFKDINNADISLFPNPAIDYITIDGIQVNSSIKIFNTVGQIVYSGQSNGTREIVNISALRNGMYLLQIEMKDKVVKYKFVKN